MQREIWKDIKGYEDKYQISNFGNIRSKEYNITITNKYGTTFLKKYNATYKKPTIANTGYYVVVLYNNKKHRTYLIHRLVAEHFIENPNNCECVNHIDGNKLNNNISNLEWCTHQENMAHAHNVLKVKTGPKGRIGNDSKLSKKIIQLDKDNNIIKIWHSMSDVERVLNISTSSISSCC